MKRIAYFVATNIAVLLVLSLICSALGLNGYLTETGLNLGILLIFAAVIGFGGAFISLALSKFIAKKSVGAYVITEPRNEMEAWLLDKVDEFSRTAGIGTPEVAIYEGEPNAFATGARRNSALVAVSTGLLNSMTREEVEAVLGHEVAHIANGDMVTMTLMQGVLNTFVFFLARVIGYVVDKALLKGDRRGAGYWITVVLCQIVLGILASLILAFFSRRREYRADADSSSYMGNPGSMIDALRRLGTLSTEPLPDSLKASGFSGAKLMKIFSTHPPLEKRIEALQK
jgi:heat shock protein HtpX